MSDKRPEVEPLSQIAWQRVDRDLFAALDCDAAVVTPPPRRGWAPWMIAGSLAAAAVTLGLIVVLLVGRDGGGSHSVEVAGASAPSRVVTQDAASEVSFGDATITVGPSSAVTLHGDAVRGVLILLERGVATFEVAPRAGRPPFVVQAGEVSVRVVGTRFTVSRSGEGARVDVAEGHVEVVARGHRAQVLAGESWSSDDDREAVVQHPTSPGDLAAAPLPPVPKPPRPRPTAPDDRARYEHAAALEASDAHGALVEYRALARGKGAWAANALYAAGRLAAELGDRDAAAALLRDYLARFPHGGNLADARALLDTLGG